MQGSSSKAQALEPCFTPILRAISPEDTQKLLKAITQSPKATQAAVTALAPELGLEAEALEQVQQLAAALCTSHTRVQEAKLSLLKLEQNHKRYQQNLVKLQQANGIAPQVERDVHEHFAVDFQANQEGQGPRGGIGEGFTLPSPQARAAQIAADERQRTQAILAKAKAKAKAERAAAAAAAAEAANAPSGDDIIPKGAQEESAISNLSEASTESGALEAEVSSTGFDGRKKIDSSSQFDYSHQQEDLEIIRRGGVDFKTKRLERPAMVVNEEALKRSQAQHEFYTSLSHKVGAYFEDLSAYYKNKLRVLDVQSVSKSHAQQAFNVNDLLSTVSDFEQVNQNRAQGLPPTANLDSSNQDFSLNSQGAYGFDTNDQRHLGAQVASAISLSAPGAAPADQVLVSESKDVAPVKAPTAEASSVAASMTSPASQVSSQETPEHLEVVPASAPSPESASTHGSSMSSEGNLAAPSALKVGESLSLAASASASVSDAPVAVEPVVLSEHANRSLDSLVSNLTQGGTLNDAEVSVDDILGSSLGSNEVSADMATVALAEIVPASSATAASSEAQGVGSGVQGASATAQADDDLPPWEVTPESKLRKVESGDSLPEATPLHSSQDAVEQVSLAVEPQEMQDMTIVPATHGTSASASTHEHDETHAGAQGSMVLEQSAVNSVSKLEVKGAALAYDEQVLEPKGALKRLDGSNDLSANEQAVQEATDAFAKLGEQVKHARTQEERAALQQAQSNAAFDMLNSLDAQITKEMSLNRENEPSPWELARTCHVINVEGREFKVELAPLTKPERRNENNFINDIVDTDKEKASESSNFFEGTLNCAYGKEVQGQDIAAMQQELARSAKEYQAKLEQDKQNLAAVERTIAQAQRQGIDYMRKPLDLLRLLAFNSMQYQRELEERRAQNPHERFSNEIYAQATPAMAPSPMAASAPRTVPPAQAQAMGQGQAHAPAPSVAAQQWERPEYIVQNDAFYESAPDEAFNNAPAYVEGDFYGGDEPNYADIPELNYDLPALDAMGTKVALPNESVIKGKTLVSDDDFYEKVRTYDNWCDLIYKVYPQPTLERFALLRSAMEISPEDKNHWIIRINKQDELSALDKSLVQDLQKAFSVAAGEDIQVEIVTQESTPTTSPCALAAYEHVKAQKMALERLMRIRPLNNLLHKLNEDLSKMPVTLYKDKEAANL